MLPNYLHLSYQHFTFGSQFLIMRRTINVFTSLIFIYSLVVCATCKQVSPDKVGNLEFQSLSLKGAETVPLMKTKQTPAADDIHFSAAAFSAKQITK